MDVQKIFTPWHADTDAPPHVCDRRGRVIATVDLGDDYGKGNDEAARLMSVAPDAVAALRAALPVLEVNALGGRSGALEDVIESVRHVLGKLAKQPA